MRYILFNRLAGHDSESRVRALESQLSGPCKLIDVSEISDYQVFAGSLEPEDSLVIAGGDGTLNCFVNNMEGVRLPQKVYYYPCGTGNDFAHDLGYDNASNPFPVEEYLKDLPTVTVKGKTRRFLNAVGYGIDGYCCEVGDKLKQQPGKKINYTAIAIRGLLWDYRATNAKVTVDGKEHFFRKVWIAPTLNGRFYGGGMMAAPEQKRNSGKLSVMVFHGFGRLRTLMMFPSIFKGEHVKYTKAVTVLEGREITVEFDRPTPLQIDGETVLDVTSYSARVTADVATPV